MAAMIRDWRVGSDRTTAQLRATEVTHRPPELDRAVVFGAGVTRVVDGRGGAFATARGGGAVARAFERTVFVDAGGAGLFATERADEFVGARTTGFSTELFDARDGDGSTSLASAVTRRVAVGFAGAASIVGAGSGGATLPADCIATGALETTGVDGDASVSTVESAMAASWCVESATATDGESADATEAVSGTAKAILRPTDSGFG